ncbi:hypothetical protein [Halalkalibacter alkaliphilus]|uniref:DUF3951 domain-containing protein n=1 Tax=Halalkalibacter alkaliphilus TaxID=2917993 RepID=A0A9X1ZY99_9BACI|nr:hypothetical protein [Halalkalibacter alkaliphilus]MCL7746556.1 hypothetical protein [Halalkalibacter alkaliphilus]
MELLTGIVSLLGLCFIVILFAMVTSSPKLEKKRSLKREPYSYIFHDHVFEKREKTKNPSK